MAISLEDLNCNKKKQQYQALDKERVLRPWEGYDKLGNQTRTIAAREAVKKARKIVEKNDLMADELRKDRVSNQIIDKLYLERMYKESLFIIDDEEIPIIPIVKSKKTLLAFFKKLL